MALAAAVILPLVSMVSGSSTVAAGSTGAADSSRSAAAPSSAGMILVWALFGAGVLIVGSLIAGRRSTTENSAAGQFGTTPSAESIG
jgi:hypothetical protein